MKQIKKELRAVGYPVIRSGGGKILWEMLTDSQGNLEPIWSTDSVSYGVGYDGIWIAEGKHSAGKPAGAVPLIREHGIRSTDSWTLYLRKASLRGRKVTLELMSGSTVETDRESVGLFGDPFTRARVLEFAMVAASAVFGWVISNLENLCNDSITLGKPIRFGTLTVYGTFLSS